MWQKRWTLWKEFLIILVVLSVLCGCGKKEEADVRTAEFSLEEQDEKYSQEEADTELSAEEDEKIRVYVCGQVRNPGVYELFRGERIVDAVAAAGGMSEQADEMYLNQAEILADEQKVRVPSKEETRNQGMPAEEEADTASGAGYAAENGKVNLNTAGKTELMTLTGIGESRADAVIAYRKAKGGFKDVEEIKQVEGIKEGIFNKIKDQITI